MSRRLRTTKRNLCSLTVLDDAKKRVQNGESVRSVARSLEMNEATLRKRLKRSEPATSLGRYDTTFSQEMEQELCSYIKKIDGMYYGLTSKGLRELAYEFAERNKLQHRFNKEKKIAGKEWLRGFRKRHPEISLRQPTSTSIARAIGFNKPQCDRFYNNLSELLSTYKFPPHSIFNMDETGVSTVPNKPPKVLSTKGKRCVNKIASAERGTNVTLVCAMSASGNFIPPTFIFPRKRMKAELLDGAPPSSIGMVSDSSFINSELFLDWLTHFKDHARPSAENPNLLILDNHASHCSIKAVEYFRKNHIHALTLPPHSSHRTQPLDRCFFNSMKKFYSVECEKWLKNHPNRAITTYQIATIIAPAYLRAATPANAVEGFKVTGISPFNPDVFQEEDFLPTEVSDRPQPDVFLSSDNLNYATIDPPVVIDVPAINNSSSANNSPTTNVISTSITTALESTPPTTCEPSTSTTNMSNITILDVAPLPRAETMQRSTRKKKKSEIISSSPYKLQLEQDLMPKKKPKIAKTFKKPAKATQNKIWKCPGCEEIYKEHIREDWIECSNCLSWWHEKCTGYINIGSFVCDLCID